jgi:hypothetical protein
MTEDEIRKQDNLFIVYEDYDIDFRDEKYPVWMTNTGKALVEIGRKARNLDEEDCDNYDDEEYDEEEDCESCCDDCSGC